MHLASIIIITKNQSKYLHHCMQSLLNQSYENIEIVIINDNSTDDTESYVKSLKNNKIKYFSIKEQIGLAKLRNYGIKNSKPLWLLD